MLSWRKKTSELPVRSWQIYDERPIEKLDERPVIAEYVENDVIRMILMNCGSHNTA